MIDIECAKLRSKMASYRRKIEAAHEIIRQGLSVCDDAFVACSFGKDSAVLLHMVMQHKPDVEARFVSWAESDLLHNFSETIEKWRSIGANIKILNLERLTLDDKVKDRYERLANMSVAGGSFVGLRSDESKGRRVTLRSNGVIYRNKKGFYRICPLAWLSTDDIAAYIYEHDLPTLDIYIKEGFEQRTTSRVPRANWGIRQEMLQNLKRRDISSFQKLAIMFPEVEEYV